MKNYIGGRKVDQTGPTAKGSDGRFFKIGDVVRYSGFIDLLVGVVTEIRSNTNTLVRVTESYSDTNFPIDSIQNAYAHDWRLLDLSH